MIQGLIWFKFIKLKNLTFSQPSNSMMSTNSSHGVLALYIYTDVQHGLVEKNWTTLCTCGKWFVLLYVVYLVKQSKNRLFPTVTINCIFSKFYTFICLIVTIMTCSPASQSQLHSSSPATCSCPAPLLARSTLPPPHTTSLTLNTDPRAQPSKRWRSRRWYPVRRGHLSRTGHWRCVSMCCVITIHFRYNTKCYHTSNKNQPICQSRVLVTE